MKQQSYRQGFVRACLDLSPAETGDWISALEEVAAQTIAPAAAGVDREGRYPHESVVALREVEAFGLLGPREVGGLDFGPAAAALAVEIVARSCASTAAILMFHFQVVRRVLDHGSSTQQANDLPRLVTGDWIGSSAWSEMGAGADKTQLETRIDEDGGKWWVNGTKSYCTGLDGAGLLHVLLQAPNRDGDWLPTFIRIPTTAEGVDLSDIYPLLGLRGSATGSVVLRNVAATPFDTIGAVGTGMRLMRENHTALMNPGLLALGIARAAYEEACAAARGEWEGLRELGQYQHTRFVLADTEMRLGSAYAYAAQAVGLAHRCVPDAGVECLKAKAYATAVATEVTGDQLNLVGARGFNTAWPVERHFRDARACVLMGPTNELIKEQIATQVLGAGGSQHETIETNPTVTETSVRRRVSLSL